MRKGSVIAIAVVAMLCLAGVVAWIAMSSAPPGPVLPSAKPGIAATARVVSLRDTGGRLNGNPAVELELDVAPPEGARFAATVRTILSVVALPRYQPGQTIAVTIDPGDRRTVSVVATDRVP